MPRTARTHMPGFPFHLTTRLHGSVQWFSASVRDRIMDLLAREIARSDVSLLAYAIMSNHLHLVLIQGRRRLGELMQPLLGSIALSVQRTHGITGHVFARRYHDTVCWDDDHLREAIGYTHANPVRAGLCATLDGYRWSSHSAYADVAAGRPPRSPVPLDVASGLVPFGGAGATTAREAAAAYLAFVAPFLELTAPTVEGPPPPPPARLRSADGVLPEPDGVPRAIALPGRVTAAVTDEPLPLDAIAAQVRAASASGVPLTRRWVRRPGDDARREFVFRADRAGHDRRAIAGYLGVSTATISRILSPPVVGD